MPDIVFNTNGRANFPTKYHGDVSLSRAKWDTICERPERSHYRHNGEKIGTTLVNPDHIREHRTEDHQMIYYKYFPEIRLNEYIAVPRGQYFAVIIDCCLSRVCTAYPVDKPKPGKDYKPREGKP